MRRENILLITKKSNLILLSLLPISLLIGTFISETILNLIVFNFLISSYIKNDWQWSSQKEFKILCIFWFYLILNCIIALDPTLSMSRAIFFIRFIIFIFAVAEILNEKKIEKKIFFFWLLIILITVLDVNFEFIYGRNIIGNTSAYEGRIASFLGEELKIGFFLYSLYLSTFAFFFSLTLESKKKNLYSLIILFIILFTFFTIILTGEKSNSIKAFFCLFLFFILSKNYLNQFKIIFIIFLFLLIFFIYSKRGNLPITGTFQKIQNDNFTTILKNSPHGAHYYAAWEIFKSYPIFGIGNKNFRIECNNPSYYNPSVKLSKYRCSTHPHQIYLEFLSELGFLGLAIFLYFLINILFKSFSLYLKNRNLILLSSALFMTSTFLPFIPSGSFFTSFGATIFWLNVGILLSNINKK
jgi:O-antigen ligase